VAAAAVVAAVVVMAAAVVVMEHQAVVAVVAMAAAVAVMEHQAVAAVVAMAAVAVVTEEEVVSAAPVPAVGKIAATATVIQLLPQLLPQIPGVLRPLTLVGVNPAVMVSMMAVAAAVAEGIAPPAQHPVKIGAITAALRVNPKSELDLAAFQCFGKPLGCFC
jgi:hypothetical protein